MHYCQKVDNVQCFCNKLKRDNGLLEMLVEYKKNKNSEEIDIEISVNIEDCYAINFTK